MLAYLKRVWVKTSGQSQPLHGFEFKVSLLIPIRNEAKRLPALILNLQKIQYQNLEIIFIDDQSEDDSVKVLRELLGANPFFRIYSSNGVGKKAALQMGVSKASGEILVTTDADCDFHPDWLQTLMRPFENSTVQLVAGPVLVQSTDSFLSFFQLLDWASIQLITGVSFARKSPLMCSGANLAFRKEAFEAVHGYRGNEQWLSGDDEFLLKKIVHHYGPESTKYLLSKKSLVLTEPEKTWRALYNQRVRWAGKWKAHQSFTHAVSAFLILVLQLIWLASLSLIFWQSWGLMWVMLIWGLKFFAEFFALGSVARFFGYSPPFWAYLMTSLWHPWYAIFIGIGAFRGNYWWKGRRIQGNVNFGNHGND